MYSHSVLIWLGIKVAVVPPKKAEKIAVLWFDADLVEYSLNVAHDGHLFLAESA